MFIRIPVNAVERQHFYDLKIDWTDVFYLSLGKILASVELAKESDNKLKKMGIRASRDFGLYARIQEPQDLEDLEFIKNSLGLPLAQILRSVLYQEPFEIRKTLKTKKIN